MFAYLSPEPRKYSLIELEIERNLTCEHYFVYCSDAPQLSKCWNETICNAIYAACRWCGISLEEYQENKK